MAERITEENQPDVPQTFHHPQELFASTFSKPQSPSFTHLSKPSIPYLNPVANLWEQCMHQVECISRVLLLATKNESITGNDVANCYNLCQSLSYTLEKLRETDSRLSQPEAQQLSDVSGTKSSPLSILSSLASAVDLPQGSPPELRYPVSLLNAPNTLSSLSALSQSLSSSITAQLTPSSGQKVNLRNSAVATPSPATAGSLFQQPLPHGARMWQSLPADRTASLTSDIHPRPMASPLPRNMNKQQIQKPLKRKTLDSGTLSDSESSSPTESPPSTPRWFEEPSPMRPATQQISVSDLCRNRPRRHKRKKDLTGDEKKQPTITRKKPNPYGWPGCNVCGVKESTEWRRDPDGNKTLCNACGLYYYKLKKKEETKLALEMIQSQS